MNYYNENDPKAALWLRNLIKGGMIPEGDVDDRSITDVRASDLKGYTQCHFFAGIGGWSEALRLANWPTTRPVWTGSCPCQSFSSAGQQKGFDDPRHLWPVWFELIKECRPPVLFGEQVSAAIRHGWLDLVQDDLEKEDYSTGALVLPACGIGAPHKRDRLWFMAYRFNEGSQGWLSGRQNSQRETVNRHTGCDGSTGWVDNSVSIGFNEGRIGNHGVYDGVKPGTTDQNGSMANADKHGCDKERNIRPSIEEQDNLSRSANGSMGNTSSTGIRRDTRNVSSSIYEESRANKSAITSKSSSAISSLESAGRGGLLHGDWGTSGFWGSADWVICTDGAARPIEPGTLPLAHGVQGRMVKIRGYGNAIVPQVAAEVIKAGKEYLDGIY